MLWLENASALHAVITVKKERSSVVLGHFSKAFCAEHLLVTKASFLRNEPQFSPWNF